MDESRRMARRRSTEETPSYSYILKRPIFETGSSNSNNNYKDDFSDVFGGPPRTLHLSRTNYPCFLTHNMHSNSMSAATTDHDHRLYVYAYDNDDDVRFGSSTRSSKSSSTTHLSPAYSYSAFNTNLRPVNLAGRWTPKPASQHYSFSGKQCNKRNCDVNARMRMRMMMMSSNNTGFSRRALSPERDLNSFTNLKQLVEDYELSSPPSSAKSSVCQEEEVVQLQSNEEDRLMTDDIVDEEEDDDDMMSFHVIEINDFNSDDLQEETVEAVGVDEAIAWAKQQYQSGIQLEKYQSINHPVPEVSASSQPQMDEDLVSSSPLVQEEQKAMELLDEGIKMWSAYKETNIQLLLSTLHHILWSNSGWSMVSPADLINSSQVKKAYQKARLCLHPDKLQQRGATPLQKYVAAEAFSILQVAWEAFISRNSS